MSEISGKVIAVLPLATGEGKNGTWKSQDYVLETDGQYPKKLCFNLFGDSIEKFNVGIDDELKVSFDIESREYNGRWYTTVKAWKVEKEAASAAPVQDCRMAIPPARVESDLPF